MPPVWSSVATRFVVLAVPALESRSVKLTVTVSFGSMTPLVGAQVSETSLVPAAPMAARKSSLIIVPAAWLRPRFALTTPLRLTKKTSFDSLAVSPITGTAIVYNAGRTIYVNRPVGGARTLSSDDVMVTKPTNSELCNVDIVRMFDQGSHFERGFVNLGDFVPYRKPGAR